MRKTRIIGLLFCLFIVHAAAGQDFYGASLAGKHIVGINATYDGKFRLGVQYNFINFNGPFNRPIGLNLQADIRLDDGAEELGTEFGISQVFANGNDNIAGFGLGTRLGFRYEYCPMPCGGGGPEYPSCHKISAKFGLLPGYYAPKYSIAPRIEADVVSLKLGCNYIDASSEEDEIKPMASVEFLEKATGGLHFDYTPGINGKIGYHLTTDLNYNLYLNEKEYLWNTYTNRIKGYESGTSGLTPGLNQEESLDCHMPLHNYQIRMSHSLSF